MSKTRDLAAVDIGVTVLSPTGDGSGLTGITVSGGGLSPLVATPSGTVTVTGSAEFTALSRASSYSSAPYPATSLMRNGNDLWVYTLAGSFNMKKYSFSEGASTISYTEVAVWDMPNVTVGGYSKSPTYVTFDGTNFWGLYHAPSTTSCVLVEYSTSGTATGNTVTISALNTVYAVAWTGTHFAISGRDTSSAYGIFLFNTSGTLVPNTSTGEGRQVNVAASKINSGLVYQDGWFFLIQSGSQDWIYAYNGDGSSPYTAEFNVSTNETYYDGSGWQPMYCRTAYFTSEGNLWTWASNSVTSTYGTKRARKYTPTFTGNVVIAATSVGLIGGVGDTLTLPNSETADISAITDDNTVVTTQSLTNVSTTGVVSRVNTTGDKVALIKTDPLTYALRSS